MFRPCSDLALKSVLSDLTRGGQLMPHSILGESAYTTDSILQHLCNVTASVIYIDVLFASLMHVLISILLNGYYQRHQCIANTVQCNYKENLYVVDFFISQNVSVQESSFKQNAV